MAIQKKKKNASEMEREKIREKLGGIKKNEKTGKGGKINKSHSAW